MIMFFFKYANIMSGEICVCLTETSSCITFAQQQDAILSPGKVGLDVPPNDGFF